MSLITALREKKRDLNVKTRETPEPYFANKSIIDYENSQIAFINGAQAEEKLPDFKSILLLGLVLLHILLQPFN
jgi:hypothetical protein